MSMSAVNTTSVVETEHGRLCRQLERSQWEAGFWRGSHQRLRKAIELGMHMLRSAPVEEIPAEATVFALERMLTQVLAMDDEVARDAKKMEWR